ncbi:MAG: phosphoglucosamine mutase [Pseudomonadota bacterium]
MGSYFGTDGIRGRAGEGKLAPAALEAMAQAFGAHFGEGATAVIGMDTRESGPGIREALTRGLVRQGVDVLHLGILPTPATAFATHKLGGDFGLMVTASHNPWQDNGVKLFGPDGRKISDDAQSAIEARIETAISGDIADAETEGEARDVSNMQDAYVESLHDAFRSTGQSGLDGLSLVIDCANGAAFETLPAVLRGLGADIHVIGAEPDGRNVNDACGSTHPEALSEAVLSQGADIGIAMDGDADRLILADDTGRVVDGDQIIARLATDWDQQGRLYGRRVVSTVMSNLGLERYLEDRGIKLHRAAVGDRYVSAMMAETGANLGGEPSGHLLMTDYGPTGDGSLAALMVLASLKDAGVAASEHLALFEPFPQLLVNVRYDGPSPLADPDVLSAVTRVDERLGNTGRVLVRASGTEPLIRIMAEGNDAELVSQAAEELRLVIESRAA